MIQIKFVFKSLLFYIDLEYDKTGGIKRAKFVKESDIINQSMS